MSHGPIVRIDSTARSAGVYISHFMAILLSYYARLYPDRGRSGSDAPRELLDQAGWPIQRVDPAGFGGDEVGPRQVG